MDIFIKSLASAAATAVILLIAKFSSPKLAGAIGGIPIVFVVSYILVTMSNRGASREFLVGGIYGAIGAICFSLVLLWLNVQFVKTFWLNLLIAYSICFVIALILVHITSK
ncbi:MAG TPA: hypothetical protein DCS29_00235 [Candidatus Magasanikbacteria bacterium]|nr:MAG: hypothetical protein A2479_03240 [Candidatus Magasanikbacteria bacterium RIFOXYC2_FULL_39_8]HAT03193.1 hypothetical protein [Candidatus Magasanikbacteria bacterium]